MWATQLYFMERERTWEAARALPYAGNRALMHFVAEKSSMLPSVRMRKKHSLSCSGCRRTWTALTPGPICRSGSTHTTCVAVPIAGSNPSFRPPDNSFFGPKLYLHRSLEEHAAFFVKIICQGERGWGKGMEGLDPPFFRLLGVPI